MAEKKNKTGLEKFMSKQFSEGVKIGSPASEQKGRGRSASAEEGGESEDVRKEKNRGGRPKKADRQEQATIIIKIDRELKKKLEDVKYMSYKSTLKDVLVEAMNDIIKKYGVE